MVWVLLGTSVVLDGVARPAGALEVAFRGDHAF